MWLWKTLNVKHLQEVISVTERRLTVFTNVAKWRKLTIIND